MMLRKLLYLITVTVVIMTAAVVASCSSDDSQDVGVQIPNTSNCYVDFAITVSNGEATRANTPTGGEDGDGREAGFERENTISGITVILYKDATGINTSANPTLDFVRYFPVTLGSRDAQGTTYALHTEEAWYHTGQQPLGNHRLDLTATYHAIVIANAPDVAAGLTEGSSHLSDVRNKTLSTTYVGNPTMQAANCNHFIMSSEQDNTINFGSVTVKNLDGTTYTPGKDMYYDLTTQPVVIERMAARIDFHALNSNGYKTSAENAAYTIPGYEYAVWKSTDTTTPTSPDKFVVTGIVPFNLTNGEATYGKEYLIKRLRTDIADAATTSYLANETSSTWVIDPKTMDKVTATNPTLTNSLENVYTLIGNASKLENTTDNPYFHSIEAMHGSTAKSTIDSKENVVVCYPMENCLLPESKLFYHATGIAIVGYYYVNGTGTGTRLVYLGYLRHQGENVTYDILPYTTPLGTDASMGSAIPMNFGVVRNNIYRFSINRIDEKGHMELAIKVKMWDKFTHSWIYM